MRTFVICAMVLALASCGGSQRERPGGNTRSTQIKAYASGPIQKACISSNRKARSRNLCGCIQAVANQTLLPNDQNLAVSFYRDPHRAQVIRQSDNRGHETFWKRYNEYARQSKAACA